MAGKGQTFTTGEFSSLTGIPAPTISKMIRSGEIKAKKISGKWMISESQLEVKSVRKAGAQRCEVPASKKVPPPKRPQKAKEETPRRSPPKPSPAQSTVYTVEEFSQMTYLTPFGVIEYLKKGRIKGRQDDQGNWVVDAVSLQEPGLKHLIRA